MERKEIKTKWLLESCPFCGGVAHITKDIILDNIRYFVSCDSELCAMDALRTVYCQLEKDAVEIWNKRPVRRRNEP